MPSIVLRFFCRTIVRVSMCTIGDSDTGGSRMESARVDVERSKWPFGLIVSSWALEGI